VVSGKLNVGDVFTVPTGDGRAGVGQVVGIYGKDAYFLAIFNVALPAEEAAERATDALAAPVLLMALSLDAKIHAGHWTVVARAPVDPATPLPAYKEEVGSPRRVDVVDHSGGRRRVATSTEATLLPNRKIVAPVRLERALRAALGLEPWLDAFDELRADRVVTTAKVFGPS
jgi:hypothetical protein